MSDIIVNILEGPNVQNLPVYSVDEESGAMYFDFKKIIPMPKELNDPDVCGWSSKLVDTLYYALEYILSILFFKDTKLPVIGDELECLLVVIYNKINYQFSLDNESSAVHTIPIEDLPQEMFDIIHILHTLKETTGLSFKQILRVALKRKSNRDHFKSIYWYDWALTNWGTKWNAMGTMMDPEAKSLISFLTANTPPKGVFEELLKKFPNCKFSLYYANTDRPGYDVGVLDSNYDIATKQFEMVHREEKEGSKRAVEQCNYYQQVRASMKRVQKSVF